MDKTLKVIQVNIYKGKWLEDLVEFLKKEDPDIVTMQEVTSGEANNWADKNIDTFDYLKGKLEFGGHFESITEFSDSPQSSLGNAVLSRLPVADSKAVALKAFRPITIKESLENVGIWPMIGRKIVDVTIDFGASEIHAISWHGAWTAPPTDTAETMRQAQMVADYLKSLDDPFILGVDLNNVWQSKTAGIINKVAKNLLIGSGIKQSTHPTVHKIAPRGFLIDFIYTSPHFEVEKLEVPEILVSDHLPVVATLRFSPSPKS